MYLDTKMICTKHSKAVIQSRYGVSRCYPNYYVSIPSIIVEYKLENGEFEHKSYYMGDYTLLKSILGDK